MTQPFMAMIIPIAGGRPDQGLPGQPPGIWGGGNVPMPTPPIYYPPSGGGGGGGQPPGIWPSPGHPSHPIAPGGRPPGIWGGAPPYPDQGLPGGGGGGTGIWGGGNVPMPTPPIYLPPGTIPGLKPEHPIYIPPSVGVPGFPTHPIVLPPPGSPPDQKPEVAANWDVKTAWSEQTGWIVAIVPSEEHPGTPTPSA
jgi:hypothetical protein